MKNLESKSLRQKITNLEKRAGNFFYDGAGDVLATNVNAKELVGLACAGIIGLSPLVSCVTARPKIPLTPLVENAPNTLTYTDDNGERQTVYDIDGLWDAVYHRTNSSQEVTIKQDRRKFLGKKTEGGIYVLKGENTIKGTLKGEGFKNIEVYFSSNRWVPGNGTISDEGKIINILAKGYKITLKRKRL